MPAAPTHPLTTRVALGLLLALTCAGTGYALAGESRLPLFAVGLLAGGALLVIVAELRLAALWVWAPLSVVAFPLARFMPGEPFVTFDRVWIGAMAVLLVALPRVARLSRPTRNFVFALAALALVWELRSAFNDSQQLYALRTGIDALVLPLILFLVVRQAVLLRPANAERMAATLVLAGALLGAVGVAQTILGFELASLSGSEARYDTGIGTVRISGPYDVPESYGLSLCLCLAATLYWTQLRGREAYLLGAGVAGLELAAIGLTYFRVAWISAVVVIFFALAFRPRHYGRVVVVLVSLGLVLAVVATQIERSSTLSSRATDTDNVSSRLGAYKQSTQFWQENPAFGIGIAQYEEEALARPPVKVDGINSAPHPHSSFFGTLAELGAVGALALLWLTFAAWRLIRALDRRRQERREVLLAAAVVGATVAYLLFSITLTMLPYSPSNLFLAVLLGLAAGRVDALPEPRGRSRQAASATPPPSSRAHAAVAR